MDLNFGKKYKDFTKEVKDFCKKYKGIHFIDSSKVPLSGSFKSGEIKMTRSDWQKILLKKVISQDQFLQSMVVMVERAILLKVELSQKSLPNQKYHLQWVVKELICLFQLF